MEYYTITLLITIIISTIIFFSKKSSISKPKKLPPGPKPWPIIGNIHQLGKKPHQNVTNLYGPIMSLKLGNITTIVISSPQITQEIFLKHDLIFSGRCVVDAITALNHHEFSIVFLPVCPRWRNLRKITTTNLFTTQQLDATQALRYTKVNELVEYVRQCCNIGAPVDIGKAAFITSLNLLSNTFFSMDLASYNSSNSHEFKDLVHNSLIEGGRPNVSDFFPVLKKFDLKGVLRRSTYYAGKMLQIFEEIIDKRLKDSMDVKDDVLGTLLKLVENKKLNMDEVKFLLVPGRTHLALEWAMTELLRNPEKLTKGQNEKDVQLSGYFVPKDAQIWVNVWLIGRNPNVWPNPSAFLPERFLDKEIDFKGRDFELIPFGAGRRLCPGLPLAYRMTHLMLATILHSFNWKCCDGVSPEDIDMEEKFGITLVKAQPLEAIPCSR